MINDYWWQGFPPVFILRLDSQSQKKQIFLKLEKKSFLFKILYLNTKLTVVLKRERD